MCHGTFYTDNLFRVSDSLLQTALTNSYFILLVEETKITGVLAIYFYFYHFGNTTNCPLFVKHQAIAT